MDRAGCQRFAAEASIGAPAVIGLVGNLCGIGLGLDGGRNGVGAAGGVIVGGMVGATVGRTVGSTVGVRVGGTAVGVRVGTGETTGAVDGAPWGTDRAALPQATRATKHRTKAQTRRIFLSGHVEPTPRHGLLTDQIQAITKATGRQAAQDQPLPSMHPRTRGEDRSMVPIGPGTIDTRWSRDGNTASSPAA